MFFQTLPWLVIETCCSKLSFYRNIFFCNIAILCAKKSRVNKPVGVLANCVDVIPPTYQCRRFSPLSVMVILLLYLTSVCRIFLFRLKIVRHSFCSTDFTAIGRSKDQRFFWSSSSDYRVQIWNSSGQIKQHLRGGHRRAHQCPPPGLVLQ